MKQLQLIMEGFLHPALILLSPYMLCMLYVFIGYKYLYVTCCLFSELLDEIGSTIIPILQIRKPALMSDN